MRGSGAGKGDALRYGVDWKAYDANYDAIFRKPTKRREPKSAQEFRDLMESGQPCALALIKLRMKHKKIVFPCDMGQAIRPLKPTKKK
jgi:hypothetical protein